MHDDLLEPLHLTRKDYHLLLGRFKCRVYLFVELLEVIESGDAFEVFLELVVFLLVDLLAHIFNHILHDLS